MDALHKKHCVPCEAGSKPLSSSEIKPLLKKIHGWHNVDDKKIEKTFHFESFMRAVSFINEVADIAEFEGHHPDINLHGWNKVTITLNTHAIKGLSENDFIVAAKIDQVIE
jgi:4a-hydroxytetrahydrobiopterin dehydratase